MKEFRLIQHWLIPFALLSANTALIHAIYLFATEGLGIASIAISICLGLLVSGVFYANKYLLMAATSAYWILLILQL